MDATQAYGTRLSRVPAGRSLECGDEIDGDRRPLFGCQGVVPSGLRYSHGAGWLNRHVCITGKESAAGEQATAPLRKVHVAAIRRRKRLAGGPFLARFAKSVH